MKTKTVYLILALCLILPAALATGCGDSSPGGISFPDPNLEAAIREAIGKPSGEINQSDLEGLTRLMVSQGEIMDLSGLENCINLKDLEIRWNDNLSDISPLSGLTNLEKLYIWQGDIYDLSPLATLTNLNKLDIWENDVVDISPLTALTNLTSLNLEHNQITDISALSCLTDLNKLDLTDNLIVDISPLADLTDLEFLEIDNNLVSDISALSYLTKLTLLKLYSNRIADISPISGLSNLQHLRLDSNNISDIKPLVDNTALASGVYINLLGNPLDDISFNTYIPALRDRGAEVVYYTE